MDLMDDIFGVEPQGLGSFNCPVCGRFSTVIRTVRDDTPMSGEVPTWVVEIRCRKHGEQVTG